MRSSSSRANSHAVPASSRTSSSANGGMSPSFSIHVPSYCVSGSPAVHFFSARTGFAAFSISSSRLWIALWLGAATPTRFPSASSSATICAARYVFPEPGGPWMKR